MIFEGIVTPDAASHSHLPLNSYYLTAVRLVTGSQSEWVLHLFSLVFPLLAVLSFYDLASRFVSFPGLAAALLALSPGFFVLGHTLMPAVPLMAFWLLSLSKFVRIVDGEATPRDWLLCALGLAGAAMLSLLSAGLVILMAAHAIWSRHGEGEHSGSPPVSGVVLLLLIPFAIWVLWYLRAFAHYDRFLLVNTALHMEKRQVLDWGALAMKSLSFVLFAGAAVLFPPSVWLGLKRRAFMWLTLSILGLVGVVSAGVFGWLLVVFVLFLSAGICLVGFTIRRSWEAFRPGHPELILGLWVLGILTSCLLLYYSGSIRYVLPAAPPMILIWFRTVELRYQNEASRQKAWIVLGLASTALLSFWLAMGDFRFASMYKSAAREVVHEYSHEGRTVWFTAEWGLRYYLEREGARLLTRTSIEPQAGDIIVKPFVAFPWVTLYDSTDYSRLLKRIPLDVPGRLRLLDFGSRAGFYSTGWGMLPYSLASGDEWEWLNVYEVKKKYDGPVPEPEKHY